MGTWGPGPFANDTADELVDALAATPAGRRGDVLRALLQEAVAAGPDADPAEVVAAAALVVAGLGDADVASGPPPATSRPDALGTTDAPHPLLDPATAAALVADARAALDASVGDDAWYWRSWSDADDLAVARRVVADLRDALHDAAGAGT